MENENRNNSRIVENPGDKSNPVVNQEGDEDIDMVPIYRKKRVVIPVLIIIVVSVVGAWYWYMNLKNFVSTDDAFIDANKTSISSKVLGRITYLGVDEGDAVTKGQVVIQLDDSDLKAQLEQARAGLTFARERIPLAQVNINRAREDFQRAELQYKQAVITKEQYDHARKSLESARAEFGIANAQIEVAKAQMAVVETQLKNMQIQVPFDGVVAKRWVMAGEIIQPGQPVYSVYDLQNIWVTANLEETKLGHVVIGDTVEVNVDTYPNRKFEGKVTDIGDYTASEFSLIPPNNASGNFTKVTQRVPVKIYLTDLKPEDSQKFPLRPGMSVEIRIRIKK